MNHLYAPWRSEYSASVAHAKLETTTEKDCVFCNHLQDNADEKHFILKRFKHTFVLLNRYPYNAGHLLILPYQHIATLPELSLEARTELMEVAAHCYTIVKQVLSADGVNMGINFGKAAGAGIPAHLHQHVLPRWFGDTNFLPTLSDTKQISFDLNEVYKKLKPSFEDIKITLL
ncbi:MAG TPA: HIT domain-containing protein [Candidatus Dependentiae bacterium]|nr:HIT domain-containing protein [Candidatus Dependentiae bacterium]HRQ63088.1 HIT domain-containing protein [Candidatus Dependentiae bacterium]